MQVIETSGHNEMCGGYSYTYKVLCDTNTVEDVLEEIVGDIYEENKVRR